MFYLNSLQICGRLTKDPEYRTTANNRAVADFRVAVPRAEGTEMDFIAVTCFDRVADQAKDLLWKGKLVIVSGRLASRQFTATDGATREATYIIASDLSTNEPPAASA